MPSLSWAEKYAPIKLSEFSGNADAASRLKRWALEWGRGNAGKPVCLWGSPGIGKSALARALASDMGWETVAFSPSDSPDPERFKKSLSAALSGSGLFGATRLVLLEDVDIWQKAGMRGIVSELAACLQGARAPAILTATEWYDRSLTPLRSHVEQLGLKSVNSQDILSALQRIASAEGFSASQSALDAIASNAGGDLRAAINDLQASNLRGSREKAQQIFAKVRLAMRASSYRASKGMQIGAFSDRDMLKMYVSENIPSEFPDAADRARALSAFSRADVFDGRISRTQYWGYLRYSSDLMMWGVAAERLHPGAAFASYAFPSYIQKMGATRGRRALLKTAAAKISRAAHTTTKKARDFFPLMAAQNDAAALSAYWGFDEEEIGALLGQSPKSAAEKKAAKPPATEKKPRRASGKTPAL